MSNGLRLLEDPQSPLDHLLTRRRYPRQVAPFAHEYLEPELVLEQLDLLAHTGLGGMQLLGSRGDVETALGHCSEITQLMQFHPARLAQPCTARRMVEHAALPARNRPVTRL